MIKGLLSKERPIAFLAIFCISLYLIFRYLFSFPEATTNIPLYITLVFGGIPLVWDLLKKALHREFGSDLLAGISIVTAVLLGEYLAAALVVLMLSGGGALENFALRRASSVLEALAKRMPSIAHQKQAGNLVDISIEQINPGDELVVLPHEICPVDGRVVEGHGRMDESYLTGEPFVISKVPGSQVISGAINGESAVTIEATKLAIDSRYAKIMEVMRASEQKRPLIRRIGDQLGAFYTPVAVGIALVAWILSGEVKRFLAVLVIATPCPLLIAIPVAIIGAISLSARRGIIIKNPVILEKLDQCRTMIVDKTGTLTYGRPSLTNQNYLNRFTQETALAFAASLEQYSKHPLANAILVAAKEAKLNFLEVHHISESPGQGLIGIINEHTIKITSRNKLIREGKKDLVEQIPAVSGLECVVLIDEKLAAHFTFHDVPRHESVSFISHLGPKHKFQKVMIVSGDREEEVRYLAAQIGIKEIYAGKTPEEKVAIVQRENKLQPTVYIGDGINDAPAMTVATVGIALGQNSNITTEAAGAVIIESSLEKVDELMHISRRMRAIALQSAVGGMILSVMGMIVAAAGYLTPVAGAIGQEIIDVIAILNALRAALRPQALSDLLLPEGAESHGV
ncbi:MAG: heavy metal translocating P-type ATPase [Candidatus Omnitrophota bacterium]|nr:heavy metal translocating P-type ATPase [Candidatus Omnitrophota bacterium]